MERIKKGPRVEEELNSSLVFFEILGLQYFSLRSQMKEDNSRKTAAIRLVYLIAVLMVETSLMFCYILSDSEMLDAEITAKNVLTYIIHDCMKIGMLVVIITSALQSYTSTSITKTIYLNIQKLIDITDIEFDIQVDFNGIRHDAKRNTAAVTVFFLLTHGTMIVLESTSSLERTLYIFMGSPPLIFLLATVFKFVFYVKMINQQLIFLQRLIEGIFQTRKINFLETDVKFIPVKAAKGGDETFKKFISSKKIYNLIYENAGLINDSMGLTVFMLLIANVIALTASGYELFVILVEQKGKDRIPESCYTIILGGAVLIVITILCQQTQRIMTKIATVVSKIECDRYEELTAESREFVHKFYMQLNHQPVLFTAYGFYTINLALLASILTGIVSYQIILVQFYTA